MVNFEQLIKDIVKVIKKNGRKEITGQVLQEVLLDMVSKSQDAEAESILRDNNLQDAITKLGGDLDTVNEMLAAIGVSITELKQRATKAEDAIADHEQRIKENAGAINANKDSIDKNANDIKALQEKDIEQEQEIKNLKDTTQIVDLDVEIRNVGGGRYVSSESAAEIYAYAIKGGNVKIQIDDKKYDFVEYKDRTAFFRNLEVSPDKVAEARIEIYEKDATFKSIEYTAIFDATPLLTSFNYQQPLTDEFIQKLNKALRERKLVYVNGNGTIYLLVGTSQSGDTRTFTGLGRNSVYVLSYGTNKIVSLDTHTIGVDIRIFNNENSVNILNLDTDSSNDEIQEVFTDSLGEILIPHTGDIFNIYQNADVSNNGSVESMVDDGAEIRLAVNMSNFEDNLIHRVFYKISYNPSVGFPSLNITQKVENVVNPSKIAESAIDRMQSDINANKAKVAKTANEVNEYNISAINNTTYTLQGAISALNAYLGGGSRKVGIKVTFVETGVNKAKTYTYQGGSFVNVGSWKEINHREFEQIYKELGAEYNAKEDNWILNGITLSWDDILDSYLFANLNNHRGQYNLLGTKFTKTNFGLDVRNIIFTKSNINRMFAGCISMQKIVLNNTFNENSALKVTEWAAAFYECSKCAEIVGFIDVDGVKDSFGVFSNCYSLEKVQVKNLSSSLSLSQSPLINVSISGDTGLGYMIKNANPSGGFTITLAKVLEDNPDVLYWVGEAQKKNITIAFA